MGAASVARVVRLTIGGAVGGILTFLVVNPWARALEIDLQNRLSFDLGLERMPDLHGTIMMLVKALLWCVLFDVVTTVVISVALTAAEELPTGMPVRILRRLGRCLWLGVLYGLAGAAIGEVFGFMMPKLIGWAILGAATGLVPGAVSSSGAKSRFGMIGGAIGGGISGLLFSVVALALHTGTVSRFIGFVVMGAAIGAAVSLVEEYAKRHWVTILSGSREGRSYLLTKPCTIVGRDELADIPLFGDTTIQTCHAQLRMFDKGVQILTMPGAAIAVNGTPAPDAVLRDGDVITIGRHRLKFSSKGASGTGFLYGRQHPIYSIGPQPQRRPMNAPPSAYQQTQVMQQSTVAVSRLELTTGPNVGASFDLVPGRPLTIGRDPSNTIALVDDTMASRRHAGLLHDAQGWRIDDLGSTNGLWVNGQRVTTHILAAGDQIGVGQTVIRVG